jgi:hypothetical protein
MRFAIAVLVSAVVQLVPYVRPGTPALLAIAYIGFAALGAGFFAGSRGPVAGALSVLCGAALYGIVSVLSAAAATSAADFFSAELGLVLVIVPYAFLGALAGLLGSWLRSRVTR